MRKSFQVELTTMCMIVNARGEVLIQERTKTDWPGWTFPGGHVKPQESLTDAVIREVKEETGLTISPTFKGIAEWLNDKNGGRELAGLFAAKVTDEPTSVAEGQLFWVPASELTADKLAGTLGELLPIFEGREQCYFKDNS